MLSLAMGMWKAVAAVGAALLSITKRSKRGIMKQISCRQILEIYLCLWHLYVDSSVEHQQWRVAAGAVPLSFIKSSEIEADLT